MAAEGASGAAAIRCNGRVYRRSASQSARSAGPRGTAVGSQGNQNITRAPRQQLSPAAPTARAPRPIRPVGHVRSHVTAGIRGARLNQIPRRPEHRRMNDRSKLLLPIVLACSACGAGSETIKSTASLEAFPTFCTGTLSK